MGIDELLVRPSTFLLLTAPPAWGKTSLILGLHRRLSGKSVFLSPLRALAGEFFKRAHDEGLKPVILGARGQVDAVAYARRQEGLLVVTPEVLDDRLWSVFEEQKPLFIVDEFHLFYLWGHGFRPLLWESLMRAANTGSSILALSATVGAETMAACRRDFAVAVDSSFHLDLGNRRFLHPPEAIVFMGWSRRRALRLVIAHCLAKRAGDVFIVFCRYRHEVARLAALLVRLGIRAVGCVGGEVGSFAKSLGEGGAEVIVATSCLGHGVNLPPARKVFITYRTDCRDMWLQMAARGGRRGEPFRLYQCDTFSLGFWRSIQSLSGCLLFDFYYRMRLLWSL